MKPVMWMVLLAAVIAAVAGALVTISNSKFPANPDGVRFLWGLLLSGVIGLLFLVYMILTVQGI
jgi:hypothetical protein